MSCALTKQSKLTFVKNGCRFFLQDLKITVYQGDPGVIIVNDLPVFKIEEIRNGLGRILTTDCLM